LLEDSKASFLVFSASAEESPLTAERLTLMGDLAPVPEEERAIVQAAYLAQHPNSVEYLEFGDFAFFRLTVTESYYVGGFGEMGWL
jgi:heme iron utilization protein